MTDSTPKVNSFNLTNFIILIVEDDALLLKMYKKRLKKEGFKVLLAGNGETALELAKNKTPNLILLDLALPTISGIEVLKQLKSNKKTSNISVIILTNNTSEKKIAEVLAAGGTDYLLKIDSNLDDVVAAVKKKLIKMV